MRVGVSAGPVWVSAGGGTCRRRHGRGWRLALAVLVIAGMSASAAHAMIWVIWITVPVWLVLATIAAVRRAARRNAARRPTTRQVPPAPPAEPLNPRMYHSDRR